MSLRVIGAASIVGAAVAGLAMSVFACNDAAPPVGSGNTVVDDTHSPASPPPDDGGARSDGDYGDAPDGYEPFDACAACKCPSKSYCLGGTTGRTSIESCALPDGGPDAEPDPPQIGCNYVPPQCEKTPTCTCLIDALKPIFPCYPVCAQPPGGPPIVYCPSP